MQNLESLQAAAANHLLQQQQQQKGLANTVELIRLAGALNGSGPAKACLDLLRQQRETALIASPTRWTQQQAQQREQQALRNVSGEEAFMLLKAENERLQTENERLYRTNEVLEMNNKKLLVSCQQEHTEKTKKLLKQVATLKGIVAGLQSQDTKINNKQGQDTDNKKLMAAAQALAGAHHQVTSAAAVHKKQAADDDSLKRHNDQTRFLQPPRVKFHASVLTSENNKFRHEIKRLREENTNLKAELKAKEEQEKSEAEVFRLSQALYEIKQDARPNKRMKIHRWG